MPFSSGQKTFAILFIVGFIALMFWAYKKDAITNKIYHKNAWVILLALIFILAFLVWLVRITR